MMLPEIVVMLAMILGFGAVCIVGIVVYCYAEKWAIKWMGKHL